MEQRQLNHLTSSAIGLGCMGLSQGYGPADDDESIRTVRRGLELGITLFDTAMSYRSGHNEELLGRALAGHRDEVRIATKFGIVRDREGTRLDGRPEHVRDYCEASLTRLGVETIDLYYLHRIDPGVPVAETVGAMAELVAEGKVRQLGLSEADAGQLEQAVAVHPITAVQFEWSLLWREAEDDVVPAARRLGIGLVCYSPLGRGLLSGALPAGPFTEGDFRRDDPRFGRETLAHNLTRVRALATMAEEHGLNPAQLALAWLLAQGPDVVPIPGTRNRERLEQNAAAVEVTLSPADLARIERIAGRDAWAGDRLSFAAPHTVRSAVHDAAPTG
jgi:aryl-alcohol dehydrogenase-like predicted oxidoreductase